jgi:glycosyltransferase involved in cell wall biosynthesis
MCDGVVVPSRNEPFGIVVLEAWSALKPVVVTQIGGPAEYVTHELNGLKVFPETESIAWGLGELLKDFDRARWMGANGRTEVDRCFEWDVIAQEVLTVYGKFQEQKAVDQSQQLSQRPSETMTLTTDHEKGRKSSLDKNQAS